MAHHLGADLDQLLLEGGQRPITHRFRRRQRPQEVGEVVGKRMKLKPHINTTLSKLEHNSNRRPTADAKSGPEETSVPSRDRSRWLA